MNIASFFCYVQLVALISAIQAVQLHENKYSKGKVAGIKGR